MHAGRGYATTPTHNAQSQNFSETRTFSGTVHSGDLSLGLALDSGEWVLAGNPYPSPIANADFVTANPKLLVSLYYFDHETAPTAGTDTFYNHAADYQVWNPLASLGSLSETTNDFTETAQGMMVQAQAAVDSLYFRNSMRRDTANMQFFKGAAPALWLGLYRDGRRVGQIAVGFTPDATATPDRLYDAPDLDLGGSTFYARTNGKAYSITGLPAQFLRQAGQQALVLQADSAGTYQIWLDSLRAWPGGLSLYWHGPPGVRKDPLLSGQGLSYTLGAGAQRALLLEWKPEALGRPSLSLAQAALLYYQQERAWLTLPPAEGLYTVKCYATDGRLLRQWQQEGQKGPQALPRLQRGLYLIQVRGPQGFQWQGHWLQQGP